MKIVSQVMDFVFAGHVSQVMVFVFAGHGSTMSQVMNFVSQVRRRVLVSQVMNFVSCPPLYSFVVLCGA